MPVAGAFIAGGAGRILVVTHEPEPATGRAVLVFPAFAEEMNKSRRLVWQVARDLAARGIATLVPDLYGTGDSAGEFTDARWEGWLEDLARTAAWAREQGHERLDALLVRFGASLYAAAERSLPMRIERAVAWQPVGGSEQLRNLLRMKSMAVRMAGGRAQPLPEMLAALLEGSEPMELGGYAVTSALARRIMAAEFDAASLDVRVGLVVEWGQVNAASEAPRSEAASTSSKSVATAAHVETTTGTAVKAVRWRRAAVSGERFWSAVEPGPHPGLVDTTVSFLGSSR